MLRIPCPHCGPRIESEFINAGETRARADAEIEAVYFRDNAKGEVREYWYHLHGCRLWFEIRRDSANNQVIIGPDST